MIYNITMNPEIQSCKIDEVAVRVILDSGSNCNLISESLLDILNPEIDATSLEIETPLGVFKVTGLVREIEISILTQNSTWKQVKVTDVLVTEWPEEVIVLGGPWVRDNVERVEFPNKTFTLFDGTDISLIIASDPKEIRKPVQGYLSVDEYFKLIETYAVALGVDLEDEKIKEKFISGLLRKNRMDAIRFGIKRPIKEIVDHLKAITTGLTDIQKYKLGYLEQGNHSVTEYFAKLNECNKSVEYPEEYLRFLFFRGLTSDNKIEARRYGTDLSLDELVAKLSVVENIRK